MLSFHFPKIAKHANSLFPSLLWPLPTFGLTTELMRVGSQLSNKDFSFLRNVDPYVCFLELITYGVELIDIIYFLPSKPISPISLVKFLHNEDLYFFVICEAHIELDIPFTHPLDVLWHPHFFHLHNVLLKTTLGHLSPSIFFYSF